MVRLLRICLICIFVILSFSTMDSAFAQSATPGCSGKLRVATGIAPGVAEEFGGGVWQGAETILYEFIAREEGRCSAEVEFVPGISARLTQLGEGKFDLAGGMITPSLERAQSFGVDFLVYDMSGSAIISKRGASGWRVLWSLLRPSSWVSFIVRNWIFILVFLVILLGIRIFEEDMLKRAQAEGRQNRRRRSKCSLAFQLLVESATTKGYGWLAPRTLAGSLCCTGAFLFLVIVGVPNIAEFLRTPYVSVPEELRSQDVVVIQDSMQEVRAKQSGAVVHPTASLADLRALYDLPEIDAALIDSPLVKGLAFPTDSFVSTNFFGDSAGVGLAVSPKLPVPPSQLWLRFLAAKGEAGKLSDAFYKSLSGR